MFSYGSIVLGFWFKSARKEWKDSKAKGKLMTLQENSSFSANRQSTFQTTDSYSLKENEWKENVTSLPMEPPQIYNDKKLNHYTHQFSPA